MATGTTPIGPGSPIMAPTGNTVADPWKGSQSPLQYYLANGGNPAMASNFLAWMQSAPSALVNQMAANPQLAFQMYTQGTGYDPASKGLTQNGQGQFVNSGGTVYSSQNDPAVQADLAAQNQQWQDHYMNSPYYNNGGQLNGQATAQNPSGINPSIQNTVQQVPTMAPKPATNPTTGGTTQTPFEQSQQGQNPYQAPAPTTVQPNNTAPVTNAVTKSTPALSGTGTANYTPNIPQPGTGAAAGQQGTGAVNQGAGGLKVGNPYNSSGGSNPYQLNVRGWNL